MGKSLTHPLLSQLNEQVIEDVITDFYDHAFSDMIIGHFFFGKDQKALTQHQIDFTKSHFFGTAQYKGRSLKAVHHALPINVAHFDRRQVLMKQALERKNLSEELIRAWLKHEEKLKPLIISLKSNCRS